MKTDFTQLVTQYLIFYYILIRFHSVFDMDRNGKQNKMLGIMFINK